MVLVVVDDLDAAISPYWEALPQTKALIADNGLDFTNAFVTNPMCCPSRASLLTGNYPHNTGVWDNTPPDGGAAAFLGEAESDTLATRLQTAGYATAFLGKYLNGYENLQDSHVPPGWDEWFAFTEGFYDGFDFDANHNGATVSYDGDNEYQTDVLAARAVEFVEDTERSAGRPFFLLLAPSAPHLPIGPAPRHADHPFSNSPLPIHPNFDEADVSDKPTWLREGFQPIGSVFPAAEYRDRLGSLLAVDEMIVAVAEALEGIGDLDDTLLVFTSDNGYLLGSHRLPAKAAPYEEAIRVPLAIAGPGVRAGVDAGIATNLDIAPTVLELAGAGAHDVDGRSLAPRFADARIGGPADFLIEYRGTSQNRSLDTLADVRSALAAGERVGIPTYRALRTGQYLYVEWYGGDAHEYELYDLTVDPYQMTNLVATAAGVHEHTATTAALQTRLEMLATCAGATCRN